MENNSQISAESQGKVYHFVRASRDTPYRNALPKIISFLEINGFKHQKTGSVYILLSRLSGLVVLPELQINKTRGQSLPERYLVLLEKTIDDFSTLEVRTNNEVPPFIAKILNRKTKFWNKTAPIENPTNETIKVLSYEDRWKEVRYKALREANKCCEMCGRSVKNRIILHVNHIKPRHKYPELALDITNLQVLCEDCNIGKGNWD